MNAGLDESAIVDGVDADGVGIEVANPEQGIIGGDDTECGMRADEVGSADLVCVGIDFGDRVAVEVAHEDLAAVGFEGEMKRRFANVEQCKKTVGMKSGVRVLRLCEANGHYLMATGAGDEGFG